jgi:hypothetical protein
MPKSLIFRMTVSKAFATAAAPFNIFCF